MIDYAYVNQCQRFPLAGGDQLVSSAGLLDARRMIVVHDARRRTLLQRELPDLTRVYRGAVDLTPKEIGTIHARLTVQAAFGDAHSMRVRHWKAGVRLPNGKTTWQLEVDSDRPLSSALKSAAGSVVRTPQDAGMGHFGRASLGQWFAPRRIARILGGSCYRDPPYLSVAEVVRARFACV